jgi:hypothetical protein
LKDCGVVIVYVYVGYVWGRRGVRMVGWAGVVVVVRGREKIVEVGVVRKGIRVFVDYYFSWEFLRFGFFFVTYI